MQRTTQFAKFHAYIMPVMISWVKKWADRASHTVEHIWRKKIFKKPRQLAHGKIFHYSWMNLGI